MKVEIYSSNLVIVYPSSTAPDAVMEEITRGEKIIRAAAYAAATDEKEKKMALYADISVYPRSEGGYWAEFE